jgi:hypothetical protein
MSVLATSPAVGTTGDSFLVEDGISVFVSAPKQVVLSLIPCSKTELKQAERTADNVLTQD